LPSITEVGSRASVLAKDLPTTFILSVAHIRRRSIFVKLKIAVTLNAAAITNVDIQHITPHINADGDERQPGLAEKHLTVHRAIRIVRIISENQSYLSTQDT
jgi:hypothetical protein